MSENGTVAIPEEIAKEVNATVAWARSLVITTGEDRAKAIDALKLVKGHAKGVDDSFAVSCASAYAAHKAVTEHRKKFMAPLEESERLVKVAIVRFDNEQEAIRAREQARLQAEADESARKERERATKAAESLKTPELREQRLEEAAMIVAPVVQIAPVILKQAGESTRKVWKAKLTNFAALVQSAGAGNELALSLLSFDESKANKFASATKGAVNVAGVQFAEESQLAIRI